MKTLIEKKVCRSCFNVNDVKVILILVIRGKRELPHLFLLQSKEIERLNGVYVNLLKNSGVEYIGAI